MDWRMSTSQGQGGILYLSQTPIWCYLRRSCEVDISSSRHSGDYLQIRLTAAARGPSIIPHGHYGVSCSLLGLSDDPSAKGTREKRRQGTAIRGEQTSTTVTTRYVGLGVIDYLACARAVVGPIAS